MEFLRKEGANGTRVYRCTECGEPVRSTKGAKNHDQCHPAPECPGCGSQDARPSLSTDYGRVDDCWICGAAFPAGGQS